MKITMKCEQCGAEWTVDSSQSITISKCPFCGETIKQKDDISSIAEGIRRIISMQDNKVLADGQRFVGMLVDFIDCSPREKNLVKIAVESGLYREIFDASDKIAIAKQRMQFMSEDYAIESDSIVDMTNWMLQALYEDKLPYEEKEKEIVVKTVEKEVVPPKPQDTVKSYKNNLYIDNQSLVYKIIGDIAELVDDPDTYYSGKVVVPNSIVYQGIEYQVESIGENAFKSCPSLTKVTLPNSIVSIGPYAFAYCPKLKNVDILSKELRVLGEDVFRESAINNITIPSNVISIGPQCFLDCKKLKKIDMSDSVRTLGDSVFMNCTSLESATLSNNIGYIPPRAFSGCENLSRINMPTGIFAIREQAFYGCNALQTLDLSNVHILGEETFYGCSSLQKVDLSKINHLPTGGFLNCSSLEVVIFSDDLNVIERGAFSCCEQLESLYLPASISRIYNWAFSGCESMQYIVLPKDTDFVGYGAFMNCPNMTIYSKDSEPDGWDPKWNCDNNEVVWDYKD